MMGRKQGTRRNSTIIISATLLVCVLTSSPLLAGEEGGSPLMEKIGEWDVQAGATLDLYGKYIWRGQTLVDEPVFQPGAYVGVENFTVAIWGNYMLTDEEEWTELDYVLDYTRSLEFINPEWEKVSVSLGYIYYDFPNLPAGDDSQEVYAGVSVDMLLSPSFTVYYDYDQGDGTYYEFGVSHSLPLDKLSFNLSATVGYNDGQWDFDSSFSNALLGASLTFPLTDHVSFEPGVFYSVALDSQYDDELYGGFSLSIDF